MFYFVAFREPSFELYHSTWRLRVLAPRSVATLSGAQVDVLTKNKNMSIKHQIDSQINRKSICSTNLEYVFLLPIFPGFFISTNVMANTATIATCIPTSRRPDFQPSCRCPTCRHRCKVLAADASLCQTSRTTEPPNGAKTRSYSFMCFSVFARWIRPVKDSQI